MHPVNTRGRNKAMEFPGTPMDETLISNIFKSYDAYNAPIFWSMHMGSLWALGQDAMECP